MRNLVYGIIEIIAFSWFVLRLLKLFSIKYFNTCVIVIFIYSLSLLNMASAEMLQATVSDSTGIVGIDMAIGAELFPVITEVFENSPASRSGLKTGDKIIAIDNMSTINLSTKQIDVAIPDIPGKKVMFTILRRNKHYNYIVEVAPIVKFNNNIQAMFFDN